MIRRLHMETNVMDILVTVLVAVLSSTGLWNFLELRKRKMIETAEKDMCMCNDTKRLLIALAKVQICQMCVAFIERGYILNEEADLLEELFTPYHELANTGDSDEVLYKQAINLPRKANKMKGDLKDDVS